MIPLKFYTNFYVTSLKDWMKFINLTEVHEAAKWNSDLIRNIENEKKVFNNILTRLIKKVRRITLNFYGNILR